MGQELWETQGNRPEQDPALREMSSISAESDMARKANVERLKAEIAAGDYRVSGEGLAAKLVRRLRWW